MSGSSSRRSAAIAGPSGLDLLGIGRILWQGRGAIVVTTAPRGRIVLWNPAAAALFGYATEEAARLRLSALFPGRTPALVRAVLTGATTAGQDGGTPEGQPLRLVMRHASGVDLPVDVTLSRDDAAGGAFLIALIRDLGTPRGEDEQAAHLTTLLSVARSLSSTLDLRRLLDLILQELRHVADYAGATVARRDGDVLVVLANRAGSRAGSSLGAEIEGRRIPLSRGKAIWRTLSRGKPVLVADMQEDTTYSRAYRAVVGRLLGERLQAIRAWMAVPLISRGEVAGFIALSHGTPGFYTAQHASFAAAIANHAAVAIDNARLYEQTQEAVRRATALARIAASVALGGALDTVLDALAGRVVQASGAVACAVLLADGDPPRLRIAGSHGLPGGYAAAYNRIVRGEEPSDNVSVFLERRPRVSRKVWRGLLKRPAYRPIHPFAKQVSWDSIALVPLVTRERPVGTLATYYRAGEEPDERELALLTAIADQAAVAVENARLFDAAGEKAALEERTRLAQDLHDSVTQTVFSLGMLSRAAQAQHEQRSAKLGETLDRVATLAREALVEMRALLFELRPTSLSEEGLVGALAKLVEAVQTRTNLAISYRATEALRLSPDIELAVFRIVQEALSNAAKHAQASEVAVELAMDESGLRVSVADNGGGFDPGAPVVPSADGARGGQGMRSMRERATAVGLHLRVESAPGEGTRVIVQLPAVSARLP
ncbi:MAG TPA: GAF domain-containing protein [Dehalococcoidia bacterium]|nr:GAF domain-containing protein [Dehalococcoidia bacterium]